MNLSGRSEETDRLAAAGFVEAELVYSMGSRITTLLCASMLAGPETVMLPALSFSSRYSRRASCRQSCWASSKFAGLGRSRRLGMKRSWLVNSNVSVCSRLVT